MNSTEKRFADLAKSENWDGRPNGWPDNTVYMANGEKFVVEIKHDACDRLSEEQLEKKAFLESLGVRYFVWHPELDWNLFVNHVHEQLGLPNPKRKPSIKHVLFKRDPELGDVLQRRKY